MEKHFGAKKAGKLKQRLMELGAADTLADISHLPPARCHELTGKDAGTFSVDCRTSLSTVVYFRR